MKTHVKRSVCFFLCLIFVLFLVVSEALAMVSETDVSVVMDTWEIVPALEDPFGKWFPWLVDWERNISKIGAMFPFPGQGRKTLAFGFRGGFLQIRRPFIIYMKKTSKWWPRCNHDKLYLC